VAANELLRVPCDLDLADVTGRKPKSDRSIRGLEHTVAFLGQDSLDQTSHRSFVLDEDPTVKMLAVGMAAAVLIDASVIRMILVPAVMSLLGTHAWYIPRWLDRITPNIDIEGSEHLARLAAAESVPSDEPESAPA